MILKKSLYPGLAVLVALIVIVAAFIGYFRPEKTPPPPPETASITILWAQWPPADYLQELSLGFTRETGIRVDIVQESWSTWQTTFFDEMAKKGTKYDMVIGDSQWLGRGAMDGHYIELTRWIKQHEVDTTMIPAAIAGYSEFPKGGGNYWAVPVEGDATGFAYRKDLFENPQEQKNFKARYGYDLKTPDTWFQLKDIAEFFYRPEKDFYGVLLFAEPRYDGITMGINSLIWAWGGDLGDYETFRVKGVLNKNEGIDALSFYKQLNAFNNPEWIHNYLDTDSNSNQPMMQGKVAMAMGYFAINPDLLDPSKNPHANVIGFFANPRGPGGKVTSLGGQGISVVSYTQKKEFCFSFLEWFVRNDVQARWADLGGLSCNRKVLNSKKFLNASPINKAFRDSIEIARDFWAVPEYPQLLSVSQKYWSGYVNEDKYTAKEAMDKVAQEWENIFEYSGYYQE